MRRGGAAATAALLLALLGGCQAQALWSDWPQFLAGATDLVTTAKQHFGLVPFLGNAAVVRRAGRRRRAAANGALRPRGAAGCAAPASPTGLLTATMHCRRPLNCAPCLPPPPAPRLQILFPAVYDDMSVIPIERWVVERSAAPDMSGAQQLSLSGAKLGLGWYTLQDPMANWPTNPATGAPLRPYYRATLCRNADCSTSAASSPAQPQDQWGQTDALNFWHFEARDGTDARVSRRGGRPNLTVLGRLQEPRPTGEL